VDFINRGVTPYHVVEECSQRLLASGFQHLSEKNPWKILVCVCMCVCVCVCVCVRTPSATAPASSPPIMSCLRDLPTLPLFLSAICGRFVSISNTLSCTCSTHPSSPEASTSSHATAPPSAHLRSVRSTAQATASTWWGRTQTARASSSSL